MTIAIKPAAAARQYHYLPVGADGSCRGLLPEDRSRFRVPGEVSTRSLDGRRIDAPGRFRPDGGTLRGRRGAAARERSLCYLADVPVAGNTVGLELDRSAGRFRPAGCGGANRRFLASSMNHGPAEFIAEGLLAISVLILLTAIPFAPAPGRRSHRFRLPGLS